MQAFRYPRQSQPQGSVGIDWGNPITRGLVSAINPASLTAKQFAVGTLAFETLQNGRAIVGNSSGMATEIVPAFDSAATIFTLSNLMASASGLNSPVSIGTTSAGNQIFGLQGAPGSSNARAVIRAVNAGGISTAEVNIIGGASSGGIEPWCAVYDGTSNLTVYRNGRDATISRLNTAASGAMSQMDNFSVGGVNRGTDTISESGQKELLGIVWNRALSAAEIASISVNPWQIFTPIAKQRYPSAGPLIIRPAGDVTTTGWTSTGANFYDQINEVTANDTNYITSPDLNSSPAAYKWTITPTPLAAGTWAVSVRCSDVAASGQIRIRFLDAGSASVGVSSYQTVTGAFATQTHTVVTSASAVYGAIEVAP